MEGNKKRIISILIVLLVVICFSVSSAVLAKEIVQGKEKIRIDVDINDGKPIIESKDFLFEPGATIKKTFFLKNNSDGDVYYSLYLKDTDGILSEYLNVAIMDGDKTLYSGRFSELTKTNPAVGLESLKLREKKNLDIYFSMPSDVGNDAKAGTVTFVLAADLKQDDTPKFLYGDADSNGVVNSIDATLVLRYNAGLIPASDINMISSEVNDDGVVNTVDATLILRHNAKLITLFPIEEK